MPYLDEVLHYRPFYCLGGWEVWHSVVPLIAWEVVELHLPHRVLRQFGRRQTIPRVIDTSTALHDISRLNNAGTDWTVRHQHWIQLWEHMTDTLAEGENWDPMYPDPAYMRWYRNRTVLYVAQPHDRRMQNTGHDTIVGDVEYVVLVFSL